MSERKRLKAVPSGPEDSPDDITELLPYRIDLWSADKRTIERVLGRVASATLAQAIFKAARTEHPRRYVTLRQGARVIAESE